MFYHFIFYFIFLRFTLVSSATQLEINRMQIALEEEYKEANYKQVVQVYDTLKTKSELLPPALLLYVAHAAQQVNDTVTSQPIYKLLAGLELKSFSSVAYNQLGIQASKLENHDEALAQFKNALLINPGSKVALYNYELTYKKHPPKSKNARSQTQQQQIEENFEQTITTQQNEEKKDLLSHTNPPRMERDRALQLLDAMRANESQGNFRQRLGTKNTKSDRNW